MKKIVQVLMLLSCGFVMQASSISEFYQDSAMFRDPLDSSSDSDSSSEDSENNEFSELYIKALEGLMQDEISGTDRLLVLCKFHRVFANRYDLESTTEVSISGSQIICATRSGIGIFYTVFNEHESLDVTGITEQAEQDEFNQRLLDRLQASQQWRKKIREERNANRAFIKEQEEHMCVIS